MAQSTSVTLGQRWLVRYGDNDVACMEISLVHRDGTLVLVEVGKHVFDPKVTCRVLTMRPENLVAVAERTK